MTTKTEKVTCQGGLHQTLKTVSNKGRVSRNSRKEKFTKKKKVKPNAYITQNVFAHVIKQPLRLLKFSFKVWEKIVIDT